MDETKEEITYKRFLKKRAVRSLLTAEWSSHAIIKVLDLTRDEYYRYKESINVDNFRGI